MIKQLSSYIFKDADSSRVAATLIGTIILGLGLTGLRLSGLGNDPCTAFHLAVSEFFDIGLGPYQLIVNTILILIEIKYGRKYIGFATIVNMTALGYIIDFLTPLLSSTIGSAIGASFEYQLLYMFVSLVLLSLGVSMYQLGAMGLAPYDYLSVGLSEIKNIRYFWCRMLTDCTCCGSVVIMVSFSLVSWENCHLGVGTVLSAFCLGPFINMFNKVNCLWIKEEKAKKE